MPSSWSNRSQFSKISLWEFIVTTVAFRNSVLMRFELLLWAIDNGRAASNFVHTIKVKGMSSLSRGNLFQLKLLNFHCSYVKFRALLKSIFATLARAMAP